MARNFYLSFRPAALTGLIIHALTGLIIHTNAGLITHSCPQRTRFGPVEPAALIGLIIRTNAGPVEPAALIGLIIRTNTSPAEPAALTNREPNPLRERYRTNERVNISRIFETATDCIKFFKILNFNP